MLVAVHPVPAVDISLHQAFAASVSGRVSIGRVEGNTISLMRYNSAAPADKQQQDNLVNMVSRWHAELDVVAGQLQLADLRAVNGCYVNDQQIEAGSRRVLQENDILSFGGPSTLRIRGQSMENPWVWRVTELHEFLATYVPRSQGVQPAPQPAAPARQAWHLAAANLGAGREVYRFSPAVREQPEGGAAAPSRVASPAASGGNGDDVMRQQQQQGGAEEQRVIISPDPDPAAGGAGHCPGNLLQQPLSVPATPQEQLDDDSDESAGLEAMAQYEAAVASQQNPALPSATLPQSGLAAHDTVLLESSLEQAGNSVAAEVAAPVEVHAAPAPAADQQAAPPSSAQPMDALIMPLDLPPAQPEPMQQGQAPIAYQAEVVIDSQADVVDLTLDSPVSLQMERSAGTATEYVDLLGASVSSPTKRRHSLAQQEEHDLKRAKPSPDAHLQAAASGAGTSGAAAAVAVVEKAGPAGPSNDMSDKLQQEIMCPICQELLAVAHAMVPCGHWFCGECLASWLSSGRKDCPSCRKKSTAAPVRQHAMDNMAALLSKGLPAEDQKVRQEKMQSWEDNKDVLAPQLAAPWRNSDGGGRFGDGSGLLSAITASIMGGGLGFGAAPLTLMGPLGGALGAEVPPWGGGAARGRRAPAVVPRHAPAAPAPVSHEFRVELSAAYSIQPCVACQNGIGELTTRIGMRQQGHGRRGAAQGDRSWRWHHLECMPAVLWREARVNGISNLRGIPPPEQSLVRQRLHLSQ